MNHKTIISIMATIYKLYIFIALSSLIIESKSIIDLKTKHRSVALLLHTIVNICLCLTILISSHNSNQQEFRSDHTNITCCKIGILTFFSFVSFTSGVFIFSDSNMTFNYSSVMHTLFLIIFNITLVILAIWILILITDTLAILFLCNNVSRRIMIGINYFVACVLLTNLNSNISVRYVEPDLDLANQSELHLERIVEIDQDQKSNLIISDSNIVDPPLVNSTISELSNSSVSNPSELDSNKCNELSADKYNELSADKCNEINIIVK